MSFLATPTGRKVLFTALYTSEGAPIGFLWWALPTKLRAAGVPVEDITLLISLLVLPWALKFLWAPLVDVLRGPRWSFRSWILLMQLLMGITLLPLLWLDLVGQYSMLVPILLLHAFAAATQDVAIDALCISVTSPSERGAINGWMQVGMLTGRSVLGGGALLMSERLGDLFVLILLISIVWFSALLVIASPAPLSAESDHARRGDRWRSFGRVLQSALKRRVTWLGLLFAAAAGAGYEAVGAVAGPFLIDRGFSTGEVGWFFAGPSILLMIAGALLGGTLSDRLERRRAVSLFLGLLVLVIFALAAVDLTAESERSWILYALLAAMYLAIGLFTASSYALFMDITDRRLGATQFSAFMGGTNLCESWSAFSVGRLTAAFDYAAAFVAMGGISLLTLPVIARLKPGLEQGREKGVMGTGE